MTTLGDLLTDLQHATGRSDDAAVQLMERGVNAGIIAASLLYRPAELRESGSLTAASNLKYVSLSSLSRFLTIEEIYNETGSCKVWPLEFSELEVLELPTTGYVKYFAVYGDVLHYRPQPSTNETLTAYYLALPARLTTSTDTLPLDSYQDFIFSFAQAFVWAGFEEGESSAVWQKVADATTVPWQTITQIRDVLNKQVPNVYDVQAAVSKGIATGSKA